MNPITKHTPGPFLISTENHRLVIVAPWSNQVRAETASGMGDYRGLHVAYIHHQWNNPCVSFEQAFANARLIAAAPDLLAELKAVHQILDHALHVMTVAQWEEWRHRIDRDGIGGGGFIRIDKREATIAQAEGR